MNLINAFVRSVVILLCCSWNSIPAKPYATQMSPRVVETQYGKIRGVRITLPNRNLGSVEAFFGVHYASVKDGELRFMPPALPMERWEGIRFASRFRPVCPQKIPDLQELEQEVPLARLKYLERLIPFLEFQTEECLNLNIYLPVRGWWNISNAWKLNIAVFVNLSCHLTFDQISRQSSHWNNL